MDNLVNELKTNAADINGFKTQQTVQRAILVSVSVPQLDDLDPAEFALLAKSAGADIIEHLQLQRPKPEAKLFIGTGKADEIAELIEQHDIDLLIFDQSLSPAQERNLERIVKCRVMDRSGLILDIFAQRARTFEAQVQIELEQLRYLSSRLVRGWGNLEQQKGGIGMRGPGETQLETDRRLIKIRITQLKAKLAKVQQSRAQGRAARQKAAIPTISLVGYTNAGKSTLFNALTDADVYAADQLFATLDPTLRRMDWSGVGAVVLADTVGFVRHLPHSLVESFKATLEETLEATLLLHVIDSSSPDMLEQIEAVEAVLKEIGADAPVLQVYNKIDASGDAAKIIYRNAQQPERVYISAHSGDGMTLLTQAVAEALVGQNQAFHLRLQSSYGKLRTQLYQLNVVQHESYSDTGEILLEVSMAGEKLAQLILQAHLPIDEIMGADAAQFKRPLEAFEQRDH